MTIDIPLERHLNHFKQAHEKRAFPNPFAHAGHFFQMKLFFLRLT